MSALFSERLLRRVLAVIALGGLILGLVGWSIGRSDWASWCCAGGTIPVVVGLLASMVRDFLAGRVGVDAVAFVSMSGALVLGQNLAGIVISVMYAGGNILEDFAVTRAERDLRSLIDRAPKVAHRRVASTIEDSQWGADCRFPSGGRAGPERLPQCRRCFRTPRLRNGEREYVRRDRQNG